MEKNKLNNVLTLWDECIARFDGLGNLPIGAKATVLILKHYRQRLLDEINKK